MKTWIKNKLRMLRSLMVFKLWAIMMLLVVFAVGFMWVVQIYLFEQNYVNSALNGTLERFGPVMETLHTMDLYGEEELLSFLSHMNSELYLINEDGHLLRMYSSGHEVSAFRGWEEREIWNSIQDKTEFENLLNGEPYQSIIRMHKRIGGFELGFPVTYGGSRAYLIVRNMLMTKTVLDLNRSQLLFLTIVLTAAAAVVAAVLSSRFIRPIYEIRDAVERLTQNDFDIPDTDRQDELGLLSHSVAELGRALQRIDVLRKELIANISHELRSPLALISGYAEMVRDITWQNDEMRQENLNLIINESNRMSEMVNDILDYSQFQAGYALLHQGDYHLDEIIEDEIERCRHAAAEHEISILFRKTVDGTAVDLQTGENTEAFSVRADALKMSQVMRNLLNNAVNHTKEGGNVEVALNASAGRLHVSVINPGEPISEEDKKIIWERYQRSQHQSGRRLGTGIGLSIVRTILEAHKMSYGVESADGTNDFWFECEAGL